MAHVMTFNHASQDDLLALNASGCSELFVGIESGSPQVLKGLHKTRNIDVIKRNLTKVFQAGISIKGYFIYGFPSEGEDDFKKTYDLAKYLMDEAKANKVGFRTSVFQFRPYHGTELYNQLLMQGELIPSTYAIKPDNRLSRLVGRLQFNFESGNYSSEKSDVIHDYIRRTIELTD